MILVKFKLNCQAFKLDSDATQAHAFKLDSDATQAHATVTRLW